MKCFTYFVCVSMKTSFSSFSSLAHLLNVGRHLFMHAYVHALPNLALVHANNVGTALQSSTEADVLLLTVTMRTRTFGQTAFIRCTFHINSENLAVSASSFHSLVVVPHQAY